MLLDNNGHLVKTNDLLDEIWGKDNTNVSPANVRSQVYNLRKILEEYPSRPKYVTTKKGVGVKFFANDLKEAGPLSYATSIQQVAGETADASTQTIAVVPFKFRNASVQHETLAVSLAYTVTLKLSQNLSYRVCHIAEVMKRYVIHKDPIRIGRALRVQYIVEVIVDADKRCSRLIIRLIDIRRGTVLREQIVEEKSLNIFSMPDVICDKVALVISAAFDARSRVPADFSISDNAEVHKAYLQGRSCWSKRTATDLWKAIEHFNRAIKQDPNYAPAYAGLADSYNVLSYYGGLRPNEVFPKALDFAQRAIDIDESLAEPHASRAYAISRSQWQWDEAEKEYRRAIELDSAYATAYQWYAEHLTAMGRFDEALVQVQKARESDPSSPIVSTALGTISYFARKYDEAIEQYLGVIRKHPEFARVRLRLARAYAQKGMFENAIRECRKGLSKSSAKETEIVQLGQIYAMAGMTKEAHKVLAKVTRLTKTYVSEYNVAIIQVFIGNGAAAFEWLDRAWWSRDPWLEHLNVDPRLDLLRHDRKFEELTRRIGLQKL